MGKKSRKPDRKAPRISTIPVNGKTQHSRIVGPEASSFESFLWRLSPRLRANADIFTEPYRQHPWVFAAVDAIIRNVFAVPFLIRTGDRKDPQVLQSGPWVELFDRVNPELDFVSFGRLAAAHYLTDRGSMILLESQTGNLINPGEIPFHMWPTRASLYKPVLDDRRDRLIAWEYQTRSGNVVRVLPHQVIHWREPNPYEAHIGMGRLEAAMRAARNDWKATQYNEAFFDNDATPGLVVKGPPGSGLTPDQRREIKDDLNDKHGGFGKSWRAIILEGGWEVMPLGSNHKDMAFLEQLAWNRDEILAVFGVPKSEVGLEAGQNMITGQGKESGDRGFWTKTLMPVMASFESALWRQLFRTATAGAVWGEFDRSQIEALKPNLDLMTVIGQRMIQMGFPVNSVNERLQLGMPELKNGDVEFLPSGVTPFDEPLGNDMEGDDFPPDDQPDFNADDEDEEAAITSNAATIRLLDGKDSLTSEDIERARQAVKAFSTRRRADLDRRWRQILKTIILPHERRFRSRYRGYLRALRDHSLKLLVRLNRDGSARLAMNRDIEDALFDPARWNPALVDAARPIYYSVISASANEVFEELGGNFGFDQTDPAVVAIVRQRAARLVQANSTIRRQLRAVLEEAVSSGASIAGTQEAIRGAFDLAAARSLTIARTEVASAANQARFDVMREEGVDQHQWATAGDEAVRESHAEQDGQTVQMGTPFANGLLYPNDPAGPPEETINCFLPGTLVSGRFLAGLKAKYAGAAWEIETRRGHRLCVTPNHPILTRDGWRPARELRKGDYLLASRSYGKLGAKGNVDHQNRPIPVEQVFDTLAAYGTPRATMAGALDLYGDGRFINGDVYRVDINGTMEMRSESGVTQSFIDFPFISSDPYETIHHGTGVGNLFKRRSLAALRGIPSSGALTQYGGSVLLEASPFEKLCIGPAANWDSPFAEESQKRSAAGADFVGELFQACAGLISLDDIIGIRKFHFDGHIYDLQTDTGWILSENIISSNCRCAAFPV